MHKNSSRIPLAVTVRIMKCKLLIILLIGVVLGKDLREYQKSNLQFSADIYKQFSSQHDGNFLVCPLSAHTILSLAAIGAKEQTAKELTSALRIPSDVVEIENMFKEVSSYLDVDKDYQLSSANKIYIREDIELKNDFKTIAQNTFKSEVENINFKNKESATNVINKWVEMKTQDKIKNLLSESTIKPNTIAILINAIFFKGKWVNKFGKAYPRKFYVSKTDTVDVDMMMQRNHFFYHFDKELDAQYMELPFVGDDVVMTIVLPKEKDGLNNLEKSMATVLSEKPYEKFDSIVSIPKFTMESKIDFKSILESLGVIVPFTNSANFSGISNLPLAIDEVVQKTFIEVNEHGVTAAGATEIALMTMSRPRVNFYADRPFIYYLKHKVHGIFFVGRYIKP